MGKSLDVLAFRLIRFGSTRTAARITFTYARGGSGYRVYSNRVLGSLDFIRRAQQLGFTLDDIRDLLALGRSGRMPCKRVAVMCATHLQRINRQMAELRAFRRGLRDGSNFRRNRGAG